MDLTPAALLVQARQAGLELGLVDDKIRARGPHDLLVRWAPLLRQHRAAVIQALRPPADDDAAPPAAEPDPLLAAGFAYANALDERISCSGCRQLSGPRCLAAVRGELAGTAPWHDPDPLRLHACFAFIPLRSATDQRPGAVRWPGLAWMRREQP